MKRPIRLHLHTDCSYFAGCENMLTLFLNEKYLKDFTKSFSYRHTKRYYEGLKLKVKFSFGLYPFYFPEIFDYNSLFSVFPKFLGRVIFLFLRIFSVYPLFLFEVVYFSYIIFRIKPDVVYINNGGYPSALSCRAFAVASRICRVRKVYMFVNNIAVPYSNLFRFIDYPVDLLVVMSVDKFITGSAYARSHLERVLKLESTKTTSIFNSIPEPIYSNDSEMLCRKHGLENFKGKVFAIVGLLIPRKGHLILLDAILRLRKDKKIKEGDFKIFVLGEGPDRELLESFICDNQLDDFFVFVGFVNNVLDYLNIVDFLLFTSVSEEDFPFVILEALAMKKPVIASRIAGTPEQVIDNFNGYLYNQGDSVNLAEIFHRVLSMRKCVYDILSENARNYFEDNFSESIIMDKYVNLLKN